MILNSFDLFTTVWLRCICMTYFFFSVTDINGSQDKLSSVPLKNPRLSSLTAAEHRTFLGQLMDAFWKLHDAQPCNPALAPVSQPGKFPLLIMHSLNIVNNAILLSLKDVNKK